MFGSVIQTDIYGENKCLRPICSWFLKSSFLITQFAEVSGRSQNYYDLEDADIHKYLNHFMKY